VEDFAWEQFLGGEYAKIIEDEEFRVRNQAAVVIEEIFLTDQAGKGLANFEAISKLLIDNIEKTFERDTSGDASGALQTKAALIKPDSSSGKTMHDSEGWKSLETSMRNLQHLIEGIGTHLYAFDLQSMLEVVKKAIKHLNRFVREIAYFVINAIFVASKYVLQTHHKTTYLVHLEQIMPLVS